MTVRTLLIAIILAASQPALAQIKTLINAVETAPANIILPGNTNGMVTFRPCSEQCDEEYIRVSLNAETRFTVDGKAVKYEDFRREFATIKRAESSYALVSYETDTNTVISIQLAR